MQIIRVYAMMDKKLALWEVAAPTYQEAIQSVKEGCQITTAVLALVE